MSITATKEGRRIYLAGDTYSRREEIKAIGGHWDAEALDRDSTVAIGGEHRRRETTMSFPNPAVG